MEFCKFGNLQKYIECKRGTYISQIHPDTGKFDDNYPPGLGTGYGCGCWPVARSSDGHLLF